MPEHGIGFYGQPAILGARGSLDWTTQFQCVDVAVEADAVRVTCVDEPAALELRLELAIDPKSDVLRRCATITNTGSADYDVRWLASGAFALPEACDEILSFHGGWAAEFQSRRVPVDVGVWLRENRRGKTSRDCFPGLVAGGRGFDEDRGPVYGFHLGWSGNNRMLVEVQEDGRRQVQLGELLFPGEVVLAPGESYTNPWVYATAPAGLGDLSHQFHGFARSEILPARVAEKPRPVHLNTWEAVYFDHDVERLKSLATMAAELGVERYVLDDGWFVGRNDDTAGLGDWDVDPAKYPNGLEPLIRHVNSIGMEFGIWVEPEMVNPQSVLCRAHPDWVLGVPARPRLEQRGQLVLDLTRPEVAAFVYERLDGLLSAHAIDYLKWDHNRDLAPAGDQHGRPAARRQTLAFYALLDRLREAHPGVEIESCAGGGGRIDYEVLRRTERVWVSDNNDAIARQAIQRDCSLFVPLEVMGTHVGASPDHTTGRTLPIGFRAHTAMFGHMGLEFDITVLSEAERTELRQCIEAYKQHRRLLHTGRLYRLSHGPGGDTDTAVVATDRSEALVLVQQIGALPHSSPAPVRIPGLDPSARYRVTLVPPLTQRQLQDLNRRPVWLADGLVMDGVTLAEAGVRLPLHPETTLLLHLRRI